MDIGRPNVFMGAKSVKILPACQLNSPQARIANSGLKTQSASYSIAKQNAFRRSESRQQQNCSTLAIQLSRAGFTSIIFKVKRFTHCSSQFASWVNGSKDVSVA
jgi:uncharacterized lipoprotein YddW (UPF0748 family)